MTELGKVAYEAYYSNRSGKDYRGGPLPLWEDVKSEIQAAWEDVAQAVVAEIFDPYSEEEK